MTLHVSEAELVDQQILELLHVTDTRHIVVPVHGAVGTILSALA